MIGSSERSASQRARRVFEFRATMRHRVPCITRRLFLLVAGPFSSTIISPRFSKGAKQRSACRLRRARPVTHKPQACARSTSLKAECKTTTPRIVPERRGTGVPSRALSAISGTSPIAVLRERACPATAADTPPSFRFPVTPCQLNADSQFEARANAQMQIFGRIHRMAGASVPKSKVFGKDRAALPE